MLFTILLGLFIPLAGFLLLLLSSDFIRRRLTALIACSSIFISFLCFASLLYFYTTTAIHSWDFTLFQWIHFGDVNSDFTLHLDSLSLLMTLIITGVGFLIHVYSIGYMEEEKDFARYFACMNLFVFAMLLLVLAGDLLVLFVGWEGVGVASYLLIGFWYQRPAAAQAATKAFIVNRIGDLGLLIGLLLTYYLFGTSDIAQINQRAAQAFTVGAPILSILTFLYFIGATGKSAQLPLQVWLPDAMEGPTPVSALIHAATMVTAGVYLVVRMHPVFLLAPATLHFVGYIGAATALFAALCATAQTDLKKVLAYSTISQLGFMFLACGIGAFYAAMFHLTMHAFVKALLFLSAGNVVHMMHGSTNMEKMGGLAQRFPKTRWLFLIGVCALSGVPPLAAFFSKDLILEQEYIAGYEFLFFVALFAAALTAFYLTRAYCLTFTGQPRLAEKSFNAIKEAPRVMTIPVTVLAILSVFGGFLGFALGHPSFFEDFLSESDVRLPSISDGFHMSPETWLSVLGAIIGISVAAFMYTRYVNRLGSPITLFKRAFFVDEIYQKMVVSPLKYLSRFVGDLFEPRIIEGSVGVLIRSTQQTASWLQQMQSGQIRSYVAWMAVGVFLLIVYLVF